MGLEDFGFHSLLPTLGPGDLSYYSVPKESTESCQVGGQTILPHLAALMKEFRANTIEDNLFLLVLPGCFSCK